MVLALVQLAGLDMRTMHKEMGGGPCGYMMYNEDLKSFYVKCI